MKIEFIQGKFGKEDKLILMTTTDRNDKPMLQEPFSIFKLALAANQVAWNELEMKNGFKRMLVARGEKLFFKEAVIEAIDMAIEKINWAEEHNWGNVKDWADRNMIKINEPIEKQLKRTFQKGLNQYASTNKDN